MFFFLAWLSFSESLRGRSSVLRVRRENKKQEVEDVLKSGHELRGVLRNMSMPLLLLFCNGMCYHFNKDIAV